jgi:hypothetical protein
MPTHINRHGDMGRKRMCVGNDGWKKYSSALLNETRFDNWASDT